MSDTIPSFRSRFEKWMSLLFTFLSIGVVAGLFFSTAVSSLSSILMLVLGITHAVVTRKVQWRHWRVYLLYCSVLIVYLFGLGYSQNFSYGLKVISKSLSLLVFPVALFLLPPVNRIMIERIAYVFCLVTFFSILYSGVFYLVKGQEFGDFIAPLDLQPHYWASFMAFGAMFLLLQLLEQHVFSGIAKALHIAGILLFFLGITLLSARIVILALVLFFVFSLIAWGYRHKKLIPIIIILFIGLSAIALITFSVPRLRERVKEAINYNNEYSVDKKWGGRALRILKWKCSLSIIKDNLLLGVGTGDGQDLLQQCYTERDYRALIFWPNSKYNSHNQFIQITLTNGLIGFLFFFASLIWPLAHSLKKKDFLYVSFLLFFMFICLTESFLLRNKGIVFFSFFNALMSSRLLNFSSNSVFHALDRKGKKLA